MTILNNFTSPFGPHAVAAMGIAQKVNMVPLQVAIGFSQGVMPLISYNYASNNRKRMKDSIMFTIKTIVPLMAAVLILFTVGAGPIINSFMKMRMLSPSEHDSSAASASACLSSAWILSP